jgi:predicted RecB family nuclease
LASRLIGYEIQVEHLQRVGLNFEDKKAQAIQTLLQLPNVSETVAERLVEAGITDLETLAEASEEDLIAVGLTSEEAQAVLATAKEKVAS